jgi:serine protease Do
MIRFLGFLILLSLLNSCAHCSGSGRARLRQERNMGKTETKTDPPQDDTPSNDSIAFQRPTPSNPPNTEGGQDGIVGIVARAEKAVFVVYALDGKGEAFSQGTGFFINTEGVGVSNHHVFENGSKWVIQTFDGKQHAVKRIIRQSKQHDYVLFEVESTTPFPVLPLAPTLPQKGEDIIVLGNPEGMESTLSRGVVAAIRSRFKPNDVIQFDAAISHGSSGSPVMNLKGEVVGIATLKIEKCENCNIAFSILVMDFSVDKNN